MKSFNEYSEALKMKTTTNTGVLNPAKTSENDKGTSKNESLITRIKKELKERGLTNQKAIAVKKNSVWIVDEYGSVQITELSKNKFKINQMDNVDYTRTLENAITKVWSNTKKK